MSAAGETKGSIHLIIDFHTHTFPSRVAGRVIEKLSAEGHIRHFTDASAEALTDSMREAGIDYSVDLPVATRPEQVEHINDGALRKCDETAQTGIIPFGAMHPEYENVRAELRRLREHGIRGVKLHPAFQGRDVNDLLYQRVMGAISEEGMICLLHCGCDVSYVQHNFASVPQLLELLRCVQPQKLVLAHMGAWQCWDAVEQDLAGAPVWFDTAYCFGEVRLRPGEEDLLPFKQNLSAARFAALARKHGTDRVLFGTDSPWAPQKDYADFLRAAPLTEAEKAAIFGENAAALLGLSR